MAIGSFSKSKRATYIY